MPFDKILSINIETDSIDRELFDDIVGTSKEIAELIKKGSVLLPHFDSILLDIFASLYKFNVILIPRSNSKKSALLGRKLIEKTLQSELYSEFREETVLNHFNSALATVTIADKLIEWIKSDDGISRSSLLKQWELKETEETYDELMDESDTWNDMDEEKIDENIKSSFKKAKQNNEQEIESAKNELDELSENQEKFLEDIDMKLKKVIDSSMDKAKEKMDNSESDLTQWSAALGGEGVGESVGEKLDLAENLTKNDKLKRLSLLVGAFKEEMFNARRKVWSKRGTEVYDISHGSDLGYLIPTELVALKHPVFKREFFKKYVEGTLLQYYLNEDRGKGPFVVCLDASSSMAGDKELWSKAVCLSFHELARRQKRKFSVIVFSSYGAEPKVFSSTVKNRRSLSESQLLELADYFPGGGTDFEGPLTKSLEIIAASDYQKADILFITDGECDVSEEWLSKFKAEKKKLKFQVYSILIDLSERETPKTLVKFSDKVSTISQLQSSSAKELFINIK